MILEFKRYVDKLNVVTVLKDATSIQMAMLEYAEQYATRFTDTRYHGLLYDLRYALSTKEVRESAQALLDYAMKKPTKE